MWSVGVVAVLALGWFFLFSPYWLVTTVTVEGLVTVSEEQVLAQLPAAGRNIFLLDTGTATRAISNYPAVRDVRIIRRLPNTVTVVVTEREPILVWKTTQTLYAVDVTGTAYRTISESEREGLFIVNDAANVHVEVGQQVVPSKFTTAYKTIAEQLPQIYPDLIDHMEVGETVYDLDAVMRDGRRVRFNVLSDVAAQLADLHRFAQSRPDLFTRSVIDLRVDRWAYIK